LLDSKMEPSQMRLARLAHGSAEKLLSVINDILDFSKIEAGRLKLQPTDFNLRELVKEVRELFQVKAQKKSIRITSSVEESIPVRLYGDTLRIRQVLINLVGNAIKFTDSGQVSLSVSKVANTGNVLTLRFDVSDTGQGVEAAALPHIFEAFSQADDSMARRHEGTGLGLAISKQLVEMMGGTIGAESTFGAGSLFWFTVVLPRAVSQDKEKEVVEAWEEMEPLAENRQLRVLLAEDNLVNQEVGKLILENLDCLVDVVEEGAAAVESTTNTAYDIIFMDCQMPIVDGYEATKMIRKWEAAAKPGKHHIPIVALTAHALEGDRELCLEAGMDDYLSKPFNSAQILEMLRKWTHTKS
nr:ATP-binding protein [Geobacteraceae bacterium]